MTERTRRNEDYLRLCIRDWEKAKNGMNRDTAGAFLDIIFNIMEESATLDKNLKNRLKPYESQLLKLMNKKLSIPFKVRSLKEKGGKFCPTLAETYFYNVK